MAKVTQEQIEMARRVDLLSYLESNEPFEIVSKGNGHFSTRSHDSMDISNGKWYRWSTGQGGSNALDYLVTVCNVPFIDAVMKLNGQEIEISPAHSSSQPKPVVERRLLLPDRNSDNSQVINYLMGRGIDREVIQHCIDKGLIYESLPYHSAIFVGMDSEETPRYGSYRSTGEKRSVGDVSGSDKRYSFRCMGNNSYSIHLFESAIDALSYMTIDKAFDIGWKDGNYISLSGVFSSASGKIPCAIESVLLDPSIKNVFIHFDNDRAGREASKTLASVLKELNRFEVVEAPPPDGKDYNDFLCLEKTQRRLEIEREGDRDER